MPTGEGKTGAGSQRAFTIIEMLVVLGIIGILAAILIPTLTGSTVSAKKAKTRVQFAQWATALEGFRQEYGYYPDFRSGPEATVPFGDGVIDSDDDAEAFIEALSGRKLNGSPLKSGDPGWDAGNTKGNAFCSFGTSDVVYANGAPKLQDAFGNQAIAYLFDTNYDGMIRFGSGTGFDYAKDELPALNGAKPTLPEDDIIRASIIFYSAGAGQSASDIVKSWE